MTVQAVGISDRNGSDAGIACENSFPAVAYGVVSRHIVNLQDGGLQGGDIVQHLVGKRVDAVESDSQTYHVKLCTRITFDSCRVADMTDNLVFETLLKYGRSGFEGLYLMTGEGIKPFCVTSYQM